MLAGSHMALGAAAWLVAAPRLGLPAIDPASLGLSVLGALLPDLDHPKSWVGRRTRPLSTLLGAVAGHRGITHSLLAVLGCAALPLWDGLPRGWVAPAVVGYLSHLAADLLTPGGLQLAWPLRGTYALPLCRTGSAFEPLVVALLLAWTGYAVVGRPELQASWRASGLCRMAGCAAPHRPPQTAALRPATERRADAGRREPRS